MGMNFIDIFIISNYKDKEDFLVELCGETTTDLNGYSVILKRDKLKDFLAVVGNKFGASYVDVTRSLLEMDEDSVMEGFMQFRNDTDLSFTSEFLATLGSSKRIIDVDKQRKLLDSYDDDDTIEEAEVKVSDELNIAEDDETLNADSTLSDEEMMLLNPSNSSEEIEELKAKIADLEKEKILSDCVVNDLKSQLSILKSQAETLDGSLSEMSKEFKEVDVPSFAVDSIINTINEVSADSTKDALLMVIQDQSSLNNGYVLGAIITGLVDKYLDLGVINIE